jgi:hypothetical protein
LRVLKNSGVVQGEKREATHSTILYGCPASLVFSSAPMECARLSRRSR